MVHENRSARLEIGRAGVATATGARALAFYFRVCKCTPAHFLLRPMPDIGAGTQTINREGAQSGAFLPLRPVLVLHFRVHSSGSNQVTLSIDNLVTRWLASISNRESLMLGYCADVPSLD